MPNSKIQRFNQVQIANILAFNFGLDLIFELVFVLGKLIHEIPCLPAGRSRGLM